MSTRTVLFLLNSRGMYGLLAVVGVVIGLAAVNEFFVIRRVETEFVETRAEVSAAKVERHVTRSRRGGVRVWYEPQVVYRYHVATQPFTGNTVAWYTPKFDSETAAEAYLVALCRTGEAVCYVDPVDPASAVLDRYVDRNAFSLLVTFAGAFVLIGVLCFAGLVWFRRRAPMRTAVGWNEIDPDNAYARPAGGNPILLTQTPSPKNDPLARTRALVAEAGAKRAAGAR